MTLSVGTTLKSDGKVRKPKTAYEMIIADDDGLIHDGADYTITEVLPADDADISDLFKTAPTSLVKLARRAYENDLVENEARVLRHLNAATANDSTFNHYIPRLLQTVSHDGHAGNIISFAEEHISLAAIIRAYPKGIDFRDAVWMYKRLLVGIGYAHTQGVIHGAVLPPHVLVHPIGHGAVLVDWSYAITDPKDRIKAMSMPYADFYAPEVLRKESPRPSMDIFMAAKCVVALLGGDPATGQMPDSVPVEIRDFVSQSLDNSVKHRPQNAWDLHDQFDKLLLEVVGKPTYRPFHMPGTK